MIQKNKDSGFTLIELLVVVSIISLLSSVVLASLNSVRIKGRNTARLEAVHTLRNAFYLSLGSGNFPSSGGDWACVAFSCYQGWSIHPANSTVDTFLAPSLPQKPSDPLDAARGYGGFLYINPWTYSGLTGAWVTYIMEVGGSCGPGVLTNSGPGFIQCFLYLE
jgi:prepilin-type N-terminal cleavage/methylation domain-containing protein